MNYHDVEDGSWSARYRGSLTMMQWGVIPDLPVKIGRGFALIWKTYAMDRRGPIAGKANECLEGLCEEDV